MVYKSSVNCSLQTDVVVVHQSIFERSANIFSSVFDFILSKVVTADRISLFQSIFALKIEIPNLQTHCPGTIVSATFTRLSAGGHLVANIC